MIQRIKKIYKNLKKINIKNKEGDNTCMNSMNDT